jgi:hypothetical protein
MENVKWTEHLGQMRTRILNRSLLGNQLLERPRMIWKYYSSFFYFLGMGWDWVHLVRRPLIGLLYQPRMIDECGAVGGMRIGRGNRSTRRKAAPVPLCPPQIPHDLTWARTRAAVVGSRWLILFSFNWRLWLYTRGFCVSGVDNTYYIITKG